VSVTVAPATATVSVGATVQLSAVGRDANGNAAPTTFTWLSSNPAVATVGAAGLVTGVAPSPAPVTITARAPTGVEGSADRHGGAVRLDVITRVTFSTTTNSLPVGFQGQLFATAFSGAGPGDTVPQARTTRVYAAATPALATIDPATGVFTAVGAGRRRASG
jgi:uncharacterized protein YjdB